MQQGVRTRGRGVDGAGRWPRPGLVACWLVGLVAGPLAAQAPRQGQPEVTDIAFVGARTFETDTLESAIVTRVTGCRTPVAPVCWAGFSRDPHYLDRRDLDADLVRLRLFYYERGFREASIAADVQPQTGDSARPSSVRVVFRVEEGAPVRVAALEVQGAPPAFRHDPGRMPLQVGQPFDLLDYEATRDSLVQRLRNQGYARAEVLASYLIAADLPDQARVQYDLVAGERSVFGEIEVIGTQKVAPGVVRRLLTFGAGDLYNHDALLRSQQNLYALDIFKHAEIRARIDRSADSIIPVLVQVNEGDVHRMRVGGGMNNAECLNAEGRWISRNFFGGARRLEVRGQIANVLAEPLRRFPCSDAGRGIYNDLAGSFTVDFTQPWFFSPLNNLGAGLFVERRSVPGVFVRSASGGHVSLVRAVGSRSELTLGYRPELTQLEAEGDLIFCVSFIACESGDVQVLGSPNWLAPLAASFRRDRSNAIFAPTRGSVFRLEAEFASRWTGSDFSYARVLAEASRYRQLFDGVVFATRLRAGWARPMGEPGRTGGLGLHPQKRFFAGGPNSVRGFAQYRLGPKVLSVDAAETLASPRDDGTPGCAPAAINDGTCSVQNVAAGAFDPRPVGGAVMTEGNAEVRFPIFGARLRGAAFLDFGQVWADRGAVDLGAVVWTPGFGVRYFSPVGPIRVDLGYNSQGTELLPVVTTEVEVNADGTLGNTNRLRSLNRRVGWNPRTSFFDRLQLHFSIGQAF